ncbi:MAG TPA: twin-arginine translocase subunit TatC [Acidimicrobiales bacterium]|nr:twin-arginine translocase subunit TatC [Acidimicrobiales bacterium]
MIAVLGLRRRRSSRPPDGAMTIVEHLREVRRRAFISLAAVAVGGIVAFVFSREIISFLVHYYQHATHGRRDALVFTGPLDAFKVRLQIATYGGIVLALPVWLWQLWRFVTPALERREKRYAIPFLASSLVLFALGAWIALLTLTKALAFLLGIGGPQLQPFLTADKYLSLVSLLIVAFGLSFEFPVLLMFLLVARVLSTAQLRRWRRAAIVVIVLFAAVVTPSQDPYSLFAMAVPLYLFYEACIVVGRILHH